MFAVLHEAPFVAIEPSSGKAVGGDISGVSENFQLHTLLMDAFGRPVDPEVLAIARGDGPQQGDQEVAGAWNLYTYRALRDGRLPEPDASQSEEWIWNEGVPAVIPAIDGTRVILLGEPLYERTWNAVRTFAGLRATLDASALSEQDARAWLDRIAAAGEGTRQRRWVGSREPPAPAVRAPRPQRRRARSCSAGAIATSFGRPQRRRARSCSARAIATALRGGREEQDRAGAHLPTQPPLTFAGATAPPAFLAFSDGCGVIVLGDPPIKEAPVEEHTERPRG